jgi:hypothetical protein
MRGLLVSLSLAALLSACAGNPFNAPALQPGASRQQVIERMGQPTRSVPITGGERLQYSLQPFGRETWMVDLDASGRLMSARQVLNTVSFSRIEPGRWTRNDVEREFGPPARIDGVSSWNGPVMTYYWRDRDRSNMFYWVYLDPQGVVQRAHPGMEFVNAPNERF